MVDHQWKLKWYCTTGVTVRVEDISGRLGPNQEWLGCSDHSCFSVFEDSWHRPEVLSPSRVLCTPHSRITKGPFTLRGTLKEPQSMFSLVAKTEPSASGIPTWEQKSSPTRRTDMKFSQSLCKCFGTIITAFVRLRPIACFSAHDNTKFVSSGGDRSVFLWDVTTGNTLRRISAHLTKINVVEFNADATVVASGESIQ